MGTLTRRQLMHSGMVTAGLASAAMAAPAPVRHYLLSYAAGRNLRQKTDPVNVIVPTESSGIARDGLKKWADMNDQPEPHFAAVPHSDYADVIAATFGAGKQIDMCFCASEWLNTWHDKGWLRDDIEQLDWVRELQPKLQPWGIENMSTIDGQMIGLPNWASIKYLVYNDLHFEKAKIDRPPTTWEEFEDQCRQLQAAGIKHPYLPYWHPNSWALGWSIFVESYSDGDYIFDDQDKVTVVKGDTPFRAMLERWKRFYDAGIVPPDAFEIDDPTIRFNTGDNSFCMTDDFSHKRNNDPSLSKIAGHVHNFLNPGKTRETAGVSPMYVFGQRSNVPVAVQNDLARFYGSSDKDGEYHVATRWATAEGLGTINTEVMSRPEVRAEFSTWRDVAVYNQQLKLCKARNVQKQPWFWGWEQNLLQLVPDFVRGLIDMDDVLGNLMLEP